MQTRVKPDPRVIFALVFGTSSFAIIIREDVVAVLGLLVLTLTFAMMLGVKLGRLFKRLKRLWQVLILVTLLRSFFAPSGIVLLALWDVPLLTTGGLAIGLLVSLRLIIFIIGASMFTVYPARGLIQAMVQMKMPYEIAYMVSIGLRFVPLFAEQLRDSLTALQLRGVVIEELKLRKRLSIYTYLLLPAIVSGLQQAKELAMSMEMRAFRAMPKRTSYFKLHFSKWDALMLFGVVALCAVIGYAVFNYNFYEVIMMEILEVYY
ncbi:MAG: energy-coupling factor transporter transmembrane protein EcfT [Defluviitaleaceae bacterium]|nr:energy-coupling factor transporter transmembrane protein EcfT [Defluviitaleaceae bacterium]